MNETIEQDINPKAKNYSVEVSNTAVSIAMIGLMVVGAYTTSKFVTGKLIDRKVARKIKQLKKEEEK